MDEFDFGPFYGNDHPDMVHRFIGGDTYGKEDQISWHHYIDRNFSSGF